MKKILTCTLMLLSSCAPRMDSFKKESAPLLLGPRFQDTALKDFADDSFTTENMNQLSDLKSLMQQTEDLYIISNQPSKKNWLPFATRKSEKAKAQVLSQKFDSQSSVYLDLAYAQIRQDVDQSVNQADQKILADSDKIIEVVRQQQKILTQIQPEILMNEKLKITESFLSNLMTEVKKMPLMPEFKKIFVEQLGTESQSLLKQAMQLDETLVRAEKLTDGLRAITSFIEQSKTQLGAEDQENLKKGLLLVESLGHLEDPKTADAKTGLQALSLVWSLLADEQKVQYFQAASSDLYDFFKNKTASDIQCLIDKNCKGLKTILVLNIGVYPAIEKFGFKNIVDLINQKGREYLLTKVNRVAFEKLPQIGEMISDKILNSVAQKRIDLSQFKDQLRPNLSNGLDQVMKNLNVRVEQTVLIDSNNLVLDLQTQNLSIRNKIHFLKLVPDPAKDQSQLIQKQFEVVESLLQLPLFSQSTEKKEPTLKSDLVSVLLNPTSRQYFKTVGSDGADLILQQQSDLLSTTALALMELADWRKTSFDQGLTLIKAEKILPQFKSKSLEQSFFAKSSLMSVVLSIASQTLKLMEGPSSPLILVDNDNRVVAIQNFFNGNAGPISLAAATDFKMGKRENLIKSRDLSQFLSALIQFYQATEGLEKTQSLSLKKVDLSGNSQLNQLLKARTQIKLLIVATANFISNQFIQKNGLISKSISITNNLKPEEQYELLDQTNCIESLVRAYEITNIDVYLWSAQDIYYSMNKNLFSPQIKFYQLDTQNEIQQAIDDSTLLETYKNLLRLKPYLSAASQEQLENIFQAWLKNI